MKIEPGKFQVVRACCTSGNCVECRAGGNLLRRKRVIQIDSISDTTAKLIANNWASYDATVEPMP
jgi:hypothetical protein